MMISMGYLVQPPIYRLTIYVPDSPPLRMEIIPLM